MQAMRTQSGDGAGVIAISVTGAEAASMGQLDYSASSLVRSSDCRRSSSPSISRARINGISSV